MVLDFIDEFIGIHWILINTIIVLFLYQFVFKYWSYFEKQNVKFIRGLPLIGSTYKTMLGMEASADSFQSAYNKYSNEKIIGLYQMFGYPSYLIRDPELIKQIAIKDFEHFPNHSMRINEDSDPSIGKTLFIIRDQRWKELRGTLSPAFTGTKMRLMFSLMDNVTNNLVNYLKKQSSTGPYTVDMQGILQKVANDAIASCAYGLEVDSLVDPNNQFYKTGQIVSSLEGLAGLRFLLYISIPRIMNALKIKVINTKYTDYFTKIIKNNMEYREKHKVVRNDMIDLLMEAQKGTLSATTEKTIDDGFVTVDYAQQVKNTTNIQNWSDEDLVAQCLIFFIAGFDSVSTTMGFAIHEITVNPDVQQRLIDEVDAVRQKLDGKPVNYEELQKMKYLDMVVSETLRRWPIGIATDRIVEKSVTLQNTNGRKVDLKAGDVIWLPTHSIQNDPKYFSNPEKFDPERFNDERKRKIISGTFFPFGIGPRTCIASRFALMECKAVIFKLLSNFHLEKSKETQDPIKLKKTFGGLYPENGFSVRLRPRE